MPVFARVASALWAFGVIGAGCITADRPNPKLETTDTSGADTSACSSDPCAGVAIDPCFVGQPNFPACDHCDIVAVPNETPCDDDDRCTVEDRCQDGTCVALPFDPAVACDDGNPCTQDLCDPDYGCQHSTAAMDNQRCDDGNDCTRDEVCKGGACQWQQQYACPLCDPSAAESDAGCETRAGDNNRCNGVAVCAASLCLTDPATVSHCDAPADPCSPFACDPASGVCLQTARDDGASCSDRSSCTKDDACHSGVCVGTPVDDARCTCDRDEQCAWLDDGDLCNGTMRCADHVCVFDFASPVRCAPSDNPCKESVCAPADGLCHEVDLNAGTACDDASRCTTGDHCEAGACTGDAVNCDSLDGGCVVGACDPAIGCHVIARDPAPSACDTGVACQLGECIGTECVNTGRGCDDDDPCTADSCDRSGSAATCMHLGPQKPTCASGGVCAAGVPIECVGDHYACNYALVANYRTVDVCETGDSNCDGVVDANCVPANAAGCPAGSAVAGAWDEGAMLACAHPGLAADETCQDGWHACTYSELGDLVDTAPPPRGYYIAASVTWDPASGYSVADTAGDCVDFDGFCALGGTTQAMSWDHVYENAIAYAAEAWICEGGVPAADCASKTFGGVLCCANRCQSGPEHVSDCDDHNDCTQDSCDSARGHCTHLSRGIVGGGDACPTVGVCATASLTCNGNGYYECALGSVAGYEATETACDGLDNDCDGKTDTADPGFPDQGPPCELQAGVCQGTTKPTALCADGRWLSCGPAQYQAVPTYEANAETRCDGLDNECDGRTDNGFLYKGHAIGAACAGVGTCGAGAPGVVVCAPDAHTATCSTNPDGTASAATPEVCNGLDDDCDGVTDDEADLPPNLADCAHRGVCAAGVPAMCGGSAGWRCDYASVEGYAIDERCDGLDNDCDGQTDEGFGLVENGATRALGDVCGMTSCGGARVVCAPDGGSAICSASLPGGGELCDHVDNDCDGQTDESIVYQDSDGMKPLGASCQARGLCGPGQVECGLMQVAVCSTQLGGSQSQARPERCNGLDDDCDGQTDEAFTYQAARLGQACVGRGACGPGVVVCADETRATCSSNPEAGPTSNAQPELCNGADDDCDGQADDNVVPGPNDCDFAGVCTPQTVSATCHNGGWTCDFSANPDYHAGNEVGRCDGRDNDCDGQTDEDFPSLGAACDGPDEDQCARGHLVCAAGAGVTCVDDVAQPELCNGLDDDCDDQTDELGAAGCSTFYLDADHDGWGVAGDTACLCGPTVGRAAEAGDCNDADPTRHPQAAERCNGVDDDCDGRTDGADATDLLVGDPQSCQAGGGQGVCQGAMKPAVLCVSGQWGECSAATYLAWDARYQATEASCDGIDNDCDGATDSEDANIASVRPACAIQKGVCGGAMAPVAACTANGWAACDTAAYAAYSPAYQFVESTCDGKDNDCDGTTDEGFSWEGLAPGQSCTGYGVCGTGRVECLPGGTGAICSSQPGGSAPGPEGPETCNGLDDDCDHQTDEDLPVTASTCRLVGVCNPSNVQASCLGAPGWVCNYNQVVDFQNGAETRCDGRDNDCDGQTDEDMVVASGVGQGLHKGAACGGQGACGGTVVCAQDETIVCSTTLAAGAEVCDAADNDCDGQTDEGFAWNTLAVGAACDGVGECGVGVVECAGLQAATCSTNPGASHSGAQAETCDGKDNDCDGQTDEGFVWNGLALAAACDGTGVCAAGTVVCAVDHTHATCSTNPDAPGVTTAAEACNGQDDDCDGQTDESLGVTDSTCLLSGVCDKTNVQATCTGANGWACDYSKIPNYHEKNEDGFCDNLDNDCDGLTDEDFTELGKACDGADADLCASGTWQCPDAAIIVPTSGSGPIIEPPIGTPICVGDTQIDEACGDNIDNDCDGKTDEEGARNCQTYFKDGDQDTWGLLADAKCLCGGVAPYTAQRLQNDCDDNAFGTNPGATEVCDGNDNDCDGATDEVDALGCTDFFRDLDADDFGVDGDRRCLCDRNDGTASGYTAEVGGDCDDGNGLVNPAANEICNRGVDDNCDGTVDPVGAGECTTYYTDADVDQVGTSPSQCRCQPSSPFTSLRNDDCCDANANAFPGQTAYFDAPTACGGFDFDCNHSAEPRWTKRGVCKCSSPADPTCATGACQVTEGWDSVQSPTCGQTGTFILQCTRTVVGCTVGKTESRKQECR